MDEAESRMAAHELALIEVVAHIERWHIRSAMEAIREGVTVWCGEDERAVRLAAMDLLDEALRRYEPSNASLFLRPSFRPL
jgi:hypothetical protein